MSEMSVWGRARELRPSAWIFQAEEGTYLAISRCVILTSTKARLRELTQKSKNGASGPWAPAIALAGTPRQDFHFTSEPYCVSHDSVLNFGPSNRFD